MRLFRSIITGIAASLVSKIEALTVASLLRETHQALTESAAAHWSGATIAETPRMIRDLARDRDDYKRMAEAYRVDLAEAEEKLAAYQVEVKRLTRIL